MSFDKIITQKLHLNFLHDHYTLQYVWYKQEISWFHQNVVGCIFKPFLHCLFPKMMLISDAFSSVPILRLPWIHWLVSSSMQMCNLWLPRSASSTLLHPPLIAYVRSLTPSDHSHCPLLQSFKVKTMLNVSYYYHYSKRVRVGSLFFTHTVLFSAANIKWGKLNLLHLFTFPCNIHIRESFQDTCLVKLMF